MARYKGKKGDLTWGKYDYPMTPTQKATLDGLLLFVNGLPRAYNQPDLWQGGFYSQRVDTGAVVIGLNHQSVSVHRTGRITANQ